ncbi:MAG TPA: type II toxin-antitoxin system RelE/ParE family toxin [Candidatus Anammoximicrobium sp.]|nr:type II toxin-antitoxin system RelE/ParE family toxin [Candidatus Anammoximicrobium sp.]
MTYRVAVSEPAERDADRIYVWLRRRSPEGAVRWWQAFLGALERLKEHASGLALAPEADHFDEPLRQVLFKTRRGRTYRALFVIRGRVVHVLRVRGAGQDRVSRGEVELP